MEKRPYACSIAAVKTDIYGNQTLGHSAAMIMAESKDSARMKAVKVGLEDFPKEEGYSDHLALCICAVDFLVRHRYPRTTSTERTPSEVG